MINKKNLFILFFLIIIVSISQFIIAKKHLEFGFFIDDWLFLSSFRAYITDPILDILNGWKNIGSHNFAHSYYIGILHNFFGLNYLSYNLLNQILKIIATLTLYPLILIISRNKLLAFFSTIFFSIHYSPYGTLDNASRGEDFIAIGLMNLFLAAYFLAAKKEISSLFLIILFAIWLFATIFIDPTRLFPLIIIVPILELLIFLQKKGQIKACLKRLFIVYFPFIPLFLFAPEAITVQVRYITGLFEKLTLGNWQLFLSPFASFGSIYIPNSFWPLFGRPVYDSFTEYLQFLMVGPIFIFCILTILIGIFATKRPLFFIYRSLLLNLLAGLFIFIFAHNWINLNKIVRAPVDPGTYLTPSIIGIFILILEFGLFLEWKKSEKKSPFLLIPFMGAIFSLSFIFLTWFFADFNSIFTGVHAYLNIPSIGASVALAALLILFFERISSNKQKKIIPIFVVILILFMYFRISAKAVDKYFSYWLDNGLRVNDQQRIWNQFWTEVGLSKHYTPSAPPLIYLASPREYENGAFYNEIIVWRLASWFDLIFNKNKDNRFVLCEFEILGKAELEKFVTLGDGGKTLISNKCGQKIYEIENFFAFKLENRNLIPDTKNILKELEIKQSNLDE